MELFGDVSFLDESPSCFTSDSDFDVGRFPSLDLLGSVLTSLVSLLDMRLFD